MTNKNDNNNHVISYLLMRRIVGILGIALPFVLVITSMILFKCEHVQESISHYYHTPVRNVFLAVVFMIAFFLYSYKGYEKDYFFTRAAALLALGIAFFPTVTGVESSSYCSAVSTTFLGCSNNPIMCHNHSNIIHIICAAGFLLVLSYISLKLFTKSGLNPTPRKKIRNQIYTCCGTIMIICVILIAVYIFLRNQNPAFDYDRKYAPIFVLESMALMAFGTSWLIKGEGMLADQQKVVDA